MALISTPLPLPVLDTLQKGGLHFHLPPSWPCRGPAGDTVELCADLNAARGIERQPAAEVRATVMLDDGQPRAAARPWRAAAALSEEREERRRGDGGGAAVINFLPGLLIGLLVGFWMDRSVLRGRWSGSGGGSGGGGVGKTPRTPLRRSA
eukprot:SM004311S15910  [mRNA]  locus=s4311:16:782:- [translate_table: standard]